MATDKTELLKVEIYLKPSNSSKTDNIKNIECKPETKPTDHNNDSYGNKESYEEDKLVRNKPKTSVERENVSYLRQKQIGEYKTLLLKEERMKRINRRRQLAGLEPGSSDVEVLPRKRKRVSFEF